jgi:hypothetical protein
MSEEEIRERFENVVNLDEAKKVYKELAKRLHPDVGGSNEEFKIVGIVYNFIIKNKIYFSNESKINIHLEKIISKILHFENITIEVVGSWIWVSGNTKEIKETLKDLGFKWAKQKKMWYFGESKKRCSEPKSMDYIKNNTKLN